ncbi:putative ORFan [Tupanvirus deep ocean]|uniref:ORFan n=2 Tax=Tupanvirus TaxID=2094720 RepID=A0AC62A6Q0_9VIRU|nr:putative ORFan [Tupanvirus deep ocean]QKU33446.1 putative ORFan [Tupanvirus deep ocean]
MDAILTNVIIEKIIDYLDKNSVFVFISLYKSCADFKYCIYDRFKFNYALIKNEPNEYKSLVKYLFSMTEDDVVDAIPKFPKLVECHNVLYNPINILCPSATKFIVSLIINAQNINKNLKYYTHLNKIIIDNDFFNDDLVNIPQTVTDIKIKSLVFNKEIHGLNSVKSLIIKSASFNQTIPYHLLSQLDKLVIDSPTYTKQILLGSYNYQIYSLMYGPNSDRCSHECHQDIVTEQYSMNVFVN